MSIRGKAKTKVESGVDLTKIIVGSEGTLTTVTEAELNLVELPKSKGLLVIEFDDIIKSFPDFFDGPISPEDEALAEKFIERNNEKKDMSEQKKYREKAEFMADVNLAEVFTKLLTRECRTESIQAFKYEQDIALFESFKMLGEISMQKMILLHVCVKYLVYLMNVVMVTLVHQN